MYLSEVFGKVKGLHLSKDDSMRSQEVVSLSYRFEPFWGERRAILSPIFSWDSPIFAFSFPTKAGDMKCSALREVLPALGSIPEHFSSIIIA